MAKRRRKTKRKTKRKIPSGKCITVKPKGRKAMRLCKSKKTGRVTIQRMSRKTMP